MGKNNLQFVWNGIDLEQLRQQMDTACDDAVLAVYNSDDELDLRDILKKMATNDSFVTTEFPKVMHDFVQKELTYPFTEEDIRQFELTHEVWKKKGMYFVFILFFRALPYTYMAEKPANVLRITKLLKEHTERRVFETAQFVFDVMDEHWWTPEKRGILTALKVRIMHSAMRHLIKNSRVEGEEWNKEWGQPISQEDLIATNQVFSLEYFKGMEMLGEPLTEEEQAAWFHTWKTIGRIMGVKDELIAKDVADAWELQHKVYAHLFKDKTEAGIPLATALVKTLDHFHLPEKLSLLMMRKMLADEQFPDCFNRMLGPTFSTDEKYNKLFEKHADPHKAEDHEDELDGHLKDELHQYHKIMQEKKSQYRKKGFLAWIQEMILVVVSFFGGDITKDQQLIDIHIKGLHISIHVPGTDLPVDQLEEDAIEDSLKSVGGIMIAILNHHFRKDKNSGFRIPQSLQDHWAMKG
ncbi:oxygenase MpaB family protein [Mangrovibacterium lignilyticum]|uniref:oxygenase MpaB family protein n=1 Tax=Mangrovibacterium lignilyticum TaxID=2668052 RepID=UPI0013D2AF6D|nr:oxygenase MpaB family protein [Mangrovibacterium lignilyticum]